MTYPETLAFLYSQLPMFQRVGAAAFKKDLTNTIRLCTFLNKPDRQFKSIHVAGTNGKGSVTHMIAAALQLQGFKTGIYSSPHLKDFRERIKINGVFIPEEEVVDFVEIIKPAIAAIQPSFFEITVAMAFYYFAKEKVDYAVIETGLGGRLDSTNIITPELSVITNIGLEHQEFLGTTIPEIATEKAGIIKKEVPVVIGETHPESAPVFQRIALEKKTPILFADQLISPIKKAHDRDMMVVDLMKEGSLWLEDVEIQSGAGYQIPNTVTAAAALATFGKVDEGNIHKAFGSYKTITNFSGRWQILQQSPFILADAAHNAHGLQQIISQLSNFTFSQKHFVIGLSKEKDVSAIFEILPADAAYYFCKADIPRAMDLEILEQEAEKRKLTYQTFTSVGSAKEAAIAAAGMDDLVFIGGSLFVVGEAI